MTTDQLQQLKRFADLQREVGKFPYDSEDQFHDSLINDGWSHQEASILSAAPWLPVAELLIELSGKQEVIDESRRESVH